MATMAQLEEARAARHKILTGTKAVKIQRGDRQVEYNPTNLPALESYIAELESALGLRRPRRAFGVYL